MGLKQLIKKQKILKNNAVDIELELPGEPLIYSIKYSVGRRQLPMKHFRNEKWKSLLKCYFRSYYKTTVPVVVVVRFYVTPPEHVRIKRSDLNKETVPAVFCYEMCDYLLSFLEMLHHVLINSYRQIVKIDSEKWYSSNPRTVFKFIKWEDYVNLQNNNSLHAKSKKLSKTRKTRLLQSELQGNESHEGICEKSDRKEQLSSHVGTNASNCPLSNSCSSESS